MSKIEIKPISRKSDLVTQEHEKEILIYDLIIDKAFSLNETSSLIWNLCNGKNSVADISKSLSRKLNSSVNEDFVWLALEQLKKDNLLANGDEISIDFGNLSRRDVIRRIGFATLTALPVISVLVVPTAAQTGSQCAAASGRPNNCTCSNQGQCSSSCCSSAPRTCVAGGSKGSGTTCIANCECQTGLTCTGTPQRCQ